MMKDLASIQNDFQDYLLIGKREIEQSIAASSAQSAQTRLAIYRHAYQARLTNALANNFPCLKVYLGETVFEQLCSGYIQKFPSQDRSIRWFGDQLSAFIIDYYDPNDYCLGELADFEWNMTLAFDAADRPPIQLAEMAALPVESWGTMILKSHPSVKRMDFSWNTVSIWEAITNNQPQIAACKGTDKSRWVLWRNQDLNRFYSLAPSEAWALDTLLKGQPFGTVCEGLTQWYAETDVGMHAASMLKNWIQAGFITEIN